MLSFRERMLPSSVEFSDIDLGLPREFSAYCSEPLAQRPAGSAGKHGVCSLSFIVKQGRTTLQHTFVTHPFHLTRPWYLDSALPNMAVVYLQTPAGGFIQGDRAGLRLRLGPHAQVHLTTQAAEKIHTMLANCALLQISFLLDRDACAEYCPEPVILFPGARFAQTVDITLDKGASFFFAEIYLAHGVARKSAFEALATTLRVRETDGTLLVRDRSLVLPAQQDLTGPGILADYHVWGQALLVGPTVSPSWAREVYAAISTEDEVLCGATVLSRNRGIGIKAVGRDVPAIRRVFHTAWDYLRTQHLGVPATVFPK